MDKDGNIAVQQGLFLLLGFRSVVFSGAVSPDVSVQSLRSHQPSNPPSPARLSNGSRLSCGTTPHEAGAHFGGSRVPGLRRVLSTKEEEGELSDPEHSGQQGWSGAGDGQDTDANSGSQRRRPVKRTRQSTCCLQ